MCVLRKNTSSPVSLLIRLILKDQGHTLTTSFNLNQTVKNLPAIQETQVQSLGWEDPLQKQRVTHSSVLA